MWAEGKPCIPTQTIDISPKWSEGRPPVVWTTFSPCPRAICLYVDGFDATKDEWTKVGNNPYLDWTSSYIWEDADLDESGYYSFEDTAQSGYPTTVEIQLYCYRQTTGTATVYVYDGSNWYDAGTITPDEGIYSWKTLDVSAILDTFAKINAAKMYVIYNEEAK